MQAMKSDIIFVFAPAHGNAGAFGNHLGVAYLRSTLHRDGLKTHQYLHDRPGTIAAEASRILELQPSAVGFTVYDANYFLSLSLAASIKKRKPDVQIVFGGPTATFGAEQILEHHDVVDVCVTGEAEETGTAIFRSLLDGGLLHDNQPGVAFRRKGDIICNPLPPLVGADCPLAESALDTTPSPYLNALLTDGRAGVLTGRGCTHHCQYCVFASLGRKKLRVHSIDRVVSELEYIAEQQRRSGDRHIVAVHDDAFTLMPKRAKELCRTIVDRNIDLLLSCITRADALDDELLSLMKEAGFVSLAFGLESAVPSVLRATGKVRHPEWPDPDLEPERNFIEQVRTSVIGAKKHGFNVGVSIILGLPTEKADDGAATLRFVKQMPIDFYMHNFLWVFPGTPLWETKEQYGIKASITPSGLSSTSEYRYDLSKLRPKPKCSLEQDAQEIKLLIANLLFACNSDTVPVPDNGVETVIIKAPELSITTAEWLYEILSIGGNVIQVYPPLKQREGNAKLYYDQSLLHEIKIPVRHFVQILPKKPNEIADERWRIVAPGIDLYARHKPVLVSLDSSSGSEPFLAWLKGVEPYGQLCEMSGYLQNPEELINFINKSDEENIGLTLSRKPIPPDIKYPGRWLNGKTPSCMELSRIEVDEEGLVRCCRHGEPIGKVGDTKQQLQLRLKELTREIELRRGCSTCSNIHCPRCPFPGLDDQSYCRIMNEQILVLRVLQVMHFYTRLPTIIRNHNE